MICGCRTRGRYYQSLIGERKPVVFGTRCPLRTLSVHTCLHEGVEKALPQLGVALRVLPTVQQFKLLARELLPPLLAAVRGCP